MLRVWGFGVVEGLGFGVVEGLGFKGKKQTANGNATTPPSCGHDDNYDGDYTHDTGDNEQEDHEDKFLVAITITMMMMMMIILIRMVTMVMAMVMMMMVMMMMMMTALRSCHCPKPYFPTCRLVGK